MIVRKVQVTEKQLHFWGCLVPIFIGLIIAFVFWFQNCTNVSKIYNAETEDNYKRAARYYFDYLVEEPNGYFADDARKNIIKTYSRDDIYPSGKKAFAEDYKWVKGTKEVELAKELYNQLPDR